MALVLPSTVTDALALDPWVPGSASVRRGCHRRELFGDGYLGISTIECGADREGSVHAQSWDRPAIVLVRTGRFARRFRGRCTVVDPTQGYVGHAADEERIEHIGSAGHRCTVLTLRSQDLPELFRARSRLMPTEFRTSPATDLAHRLLLEECRQGGAATTIRKMAAELIADLVAGWAQSTASAHRTGTRAATRRIVDIARELVTTSSVAPSLQSVANAGNISPQYLTRVFRGGTGMTMSRYRNRVRVRLALEMLADEDSDLKWISHDLGFFDRSHFARVVMSEIGMSPHAVRRMLAAPSSSRLDSDAAQTSISRSA